jgi:hypothetical protein
LSEGQTIATQTDDALIHATITSIEKNWS